MIETEVPPEYICSGCGFPTDSPNHELGCGLVTEEIIALTLPQAAEQALWDLQQWTEDHPRRCDCFTCAESIPDLCRALGEPVPAKPIPTADEPFDVVTGLLRSSN